MRIERALVAEYAAEDRPEFYSAWWRERLVGIEQLIDIEIDPNSFRQIDVIANGGLDMNEVRAGLSMAFALDDDEVDVLQCLLGSGSLTDVQHRYHLWMARWPKETAGCLLEWGAGFGNAARISRLFDPRPIHVVADSPPMLALQHAFLEANGALDDVLFMPVGAEPPVPVDTFLATFSVDESSRECQDYLFGMNWFDAPNVIIAMFPDKDLFPEAFGLQQRLLDSGFGEEKCLSPSSIYMTRRQ